LLKHAVGPRELWALNSTPQNRALRNRLTASLGSRTARELLASKFPHGSAVAQIDYMKAKAGDDDGTSTVNRLADQLLNEYGYLQG
ncbi:IncI1 plasmid conjugative transfer protein TraU, partial [Salmonella enterica]|nr:IncI1 plasmid conjugative transfer protein TraU [Salmonella enterica]